MLEHILANLQGLVEGFTVRRLLYVLALPLGLYFAEWLTGFMFNWNLQRKADLLKTLAEAAQAGVTNDPRLAPLYDNLVRQAYVYQPEPLFMFSVVSDVQFWIRFVAINIITILMSVYGLLNKQQPNRRAILIALVIVMVGLGIAAGAIPTLGSELVNILVYVALNVGFLVLVSASQRNAKKTV